jgi:hypothetical protein
MKTWLVTLAAILIAAIVGLLIYAALSSPLVIATFQYVIIAALVLLVLAIIMTLTLAGFYVAHRIENWAIVTATNRSQAVQFYASEGMVYAANPAGVPIQALHLHTAPYILPGGDGEADQFNALKWSAFVGRKQRVIDHFAEPAALPPGLLPVLPVIIGSQRLLIAGGMGSGKTNLLRWIAAAKSESSKVLVIDTHAAPGLWPVDPSSVLGRGRNWGAVELALQNLLGIMDRRYKDIDAGSVGYRGHPIITVIADEWTMVPQMIGADIIKNYSKPVLVESRKVGIDFVLATHDTTVEALGTKGMSGLKTAFDFIVETQHRAGQYICRVRTPGQKPSEAIEYAAPPLFAADVTGLSVEPDWIMALKSPPVSVEIDEPGELTDDEPTKEEFDIMVAYNQAKNENGNKPPLNQVCKKLGWRAGGIQYEKIRQAMRRWTDEDL